MDDLHRSVHARRVGVLLLEDGHGFPVYADARNAAAPLVTLPPGEGASAADDAIISYTSGSTSRPKAIALAHYLVVENGFIIGERQGLGPAGRVLLSPPLFWTYGGVNALPATLTHGAALMLQGLAWCMDRAMALEVPGDVGITVPNSGCPSCHSN